jgi:hypothetical protein
MKGKCAAISPGRALWVVLCALGAACALGVELQPNGVFLFQGQTPPPSQAVIPPAEGDLLEFVDGSSLHGALKEMDAGTGLRWSSPAAKNIIDLRPGRLDSVRFAHADPVSLRPTAHFRFANGDDVFGSIQSLDDHRLSFSTWFGQSLSVPRSTVQSITFLSTNYTLVYDGPDDLNGWVIGNRNPESWVLRDGTFINAFNGTLGRDFKLTGSSTIEFDLAWTDYLDLLVNIYTDFLDRMDYNSYMLQFTRDEVSLRHVDSTGNPPKSFGSGALHLPPGRDKIHVTIQSNTNEATVAVFVDNVLVKRWKDDNGFGAAGGGVFFEKRVVTGGIIKLSNITVSQWEGRFEPETSFVLTNTDVMRFVNHDQAAGKIERIDQGKIDLKLGDVDLHVPLERVTQINFADAGPASALPSGPWEVRAHFPRGGSLTFQLEKWTDKEVSGRSDIFGSLTLQPAQIRQVEFNLSRPRTTIPLLSRQQFEELDE